MRLIVNVNSFFYYFLSLSFSYDHFFALLSVYLLSSYFILLLYATVELREIPKCLGL